MKGLLQKDFYQIVKSYKILFLYFVVFFGISFAVDNGTFFRVFPCIILGMMPLTIFSLDEKEGWCRYVAVTPVSRARYISAKYLLTLILAVFSALLCGAGMVVSGLLEGALQLGDALIPAGMAMVVGMLGTGLALPFCVKLGADKGRIIMFIVIGGFSAILALLSGETWARLGRLFTPGGWMVLLTLVFAVLFTLSWLASIHLYQKREL